MWWMDAKNLKYKQISQNNVIPWIRTSRQIYKTIINQVGVQKVGLRNGEVIATVPLSITNKNLMNYIVAGTLSVERKIEDF